VRNPLVNGLPGAKKVPESGGITITGGFADGTQPRKKWSLCTVASSRASVGRDLNS